MKYARYVLWAVVGGLSAWFLWILAGLGNIWVPIGLVGFFLLIVLVNRMTRRQTHRPGQPTPEHRVISTDQDRWGGGASVQR